jgi:quercetin dioxygenase-like cupin family protein
VRRAAIVVCVICAFAAGVLAERGRAASRPRMWADVLVDVATRDLPRSARVHANMDHWEPGAETGRHTHPGPTFFLLLEGELVETQGDGQSITIHAGEAYWRPARATHNVRNAGPSSARGVAVHLDPR